MTSNPLFWIFPLIVGLFLMASGGITYLVSEEALLSIAMVLLGVIVISVGVSAARLVVTSKKQEEKVRAKFKKGANRPDWSDPYKNDL